MKIDFTTGTMMFLGLLLLIGAFTILPDSLDNHYEQQEQKIEEWSNQ